VPIYLVGATVKVVIPSVGYGDMLPVVLQAWARVVPRFCITVVTAGKDEETIRAAEQAQVRTVLTEIWTRDGAPFRKGAGLNHGFGFVLGHPNAPDPGELCIAADADVVPVGKLDLTRVYREDTLYGVPRFHCENSVQLTQHLTGHLPRRRLGLLLKGSNSRPVFIYNEAMVQEYARKCLGYFQLFRAVPGRRFTEPPTAGAYDGAFAKMFPNREVIQSLYMVHLGQRSQQNWSGRVVPRWQ
jgi:hypothetical protein